ncbi:hypothetical protein phiAS5_ORF0140 [Aeromonas phage phiAS5]|uniref:Uncharacterized protein n=1 Tax=Aeromonas phage phiAS5 TaxID=879630 RepID=E1A2N7_9CAUD|nr:hypothetical protein phiAS5_ORF0140 [Aeromonas phage phiAS5]ADM79983.1 hypothetical protein phiAS5_ORF0140 [Aeromonas phage phiAS5]
MSAKTVMDAVYAYRLATLLGKSFRKWEAFKLGIIDDQGNVIRRPETPKEKSHYTKFHSMVRSLKQTIQKFSGGFGTSALAVKMGWNAIISEYGEPDMSRMPLTECEESSDLHTLIEMISGDSGGDATAIATGEKSGSVTSKGPSNMGKKKVEKKEY